MRISRRVLTFALGLACIWGAAAQAAPKKEFNLCWTIYAGWMPWDYARAQGIMDRWADKYGITVKITQLNDYIESINQYTAGQFDACTITNMDALTVPAAAGVDSTALLVGSYSNGNDGVLIKGKGKRIEDLKGQSVHLAELSVSHYLLARALDSVGLRERDVKLVNTSDADIVAAFATPKVQAAVAWNPQLASMAAHGDVSQVFDSSAIAGEILDLLLVNSQTLAENPELGKALVGAWFEVMAVMQAKDAKALSTMAQAAGTSLENYQSQLRTTALLFTPEEMLRFVTSAKLPEAMQRVAQFSFEKGLLGSGADSPEAIGIAFPGGARYGNANNIRLRFDDGFVRLASEGKL